MSQDVIQVSKARAGEHRWMDESGHGETLSERRALTSWRAHTDRQVRMPKGSKWARARAGTTDRWMSQDMERIQVSKGTYLPESTDGRTSQDVNPSEQGRGLESTDGWMSQDVEIIQVSEGYSPSGDWGPGMRFRSMPTRRVRSDERCRRWVL